MKKKSSRISSNTSNGLLKHIPVLVKSHPASGRENPWYILRYPGLPAGHYTGIPSPVRQPPACRHTQTGCGHTFCRFQHTSTVNASHSALCSLSFSWLPPCFLANLLPCEMSKRYTCIGPKSVPKSERSGPKNISGKNIFPKSVFLESANMPRILDFSGIRLFSQIRLFPENQSLYVLGHSSLFSAGHFSLSWSLLQRHQKTTHYLNQNPVPASCFGKLSKWGSSGKNEEIKQIIKTQNSQYLQGFPAISRQYIAPSDCAVTNEKSPAYGSVCCCLCKARFLCGYRMGAVCLFQADETGPKITSRLFILDAGRASLNVY